MRNYETLYVISPALDEEATKATIEKYNALLTDNGATISEVDEWGKRKLAYPIKDFTEGYYVIVTYLADVDAHVELERLFKISEDILRYVTVNKDEK